MSKSLLLSLGGVLAAVLLFVAANILGGSVLRPLRLDLTEGRVYTLSEGSRAIARKVPEPITLTLYFSERAAAAEPSLKAYGARVKEMLGEYARESGGKIRFNVIEPEPFSDAEDRAAEAGLAGVPLASSGVGATGGRLYFGLVGVNSTDKQETVPFFDSRREQFLEYDLTRMVYTLSDPEKRTIGLMSWLPLQGSEANPFMGGRGAPAWQAYTQMAAFFNVMTLDQDLAEIPDDVKVLVLVHPKGMSEGTKYAIDQFVLRGGRLLAFIDPHCEADIPPGMDPMRAMGVPKSSDMNVLLAAWGLEMPSQLFAADRSRGLRVNIGGQARPEPIDYLAWIALNRTDDAAASELNPRDAVTGSLERMIFATAGVLRARDPLAGEEESAVLRPTVEPLIRTTSNAAAMDLSLVSMFPDPKRVLNEFTSGQEPLMIAARVSGRARSAFPDGPPAATPGAEQPGRMHPHLSESADTIGVIVVADCDMLRDDLWVQEDRFGQLVLGLRKMADNGDFLIGALDNLSGSSDLMSVRARAKFSRPFSRVQEIQRAAEERYLEKQKELESKLRETERNLTELQQARGDTGAQGGAFIFSPEQQAEIEKFMKQRLETRKELRAVQHELNKDIEGLQRRLKFINIGLVPLAVGVVAVGLAGYRASRRAADRQRASVG